MASASTHGIVATLVDTPERGAFRIRRDALVVCDGSGGIADVLEPGTEDYVSIRHELSRVDRLEVLGDDVYLLPGLVDLHIHAPQWPQLGKALDVPLEVWLNRYTFPLEARFSDSRFATEVYGDLVPSLLARGTTTAVYFGTVHREATEVLVDECLQAGQRAVVGKVAMDDPDACPDYYRDADAALAVAESARFIDYVRSHSDNRHGLVQPAVTPRFIPSCTDELLDGLGSLVGESGCLVQTHCSESDWAHSYGLDRFGCTDTESYERFGLLRRGTVLAHSNFVTDEDLALIAARGAAVAHCPLSNAYFANAVFPVRHALELGVHVGLGTDISGGPSPSILATATHAVTVSRMLEDGVDRSIGGAERGVPASRITFAEALWMATTGGGRALGLPIGLLEPGYRFDAVAISAGEPGTDLRIWPTLDSADDIVQKMITTGAGSDIVGVWVNGERAGSPRGLR